MGKRNNIGFGLRKIIAVIFVVAVCSGGAFLTKNQNTIKQSVIVNKANVSINTASEFLDIVSAAPDSTLTELNAINEFVIPELDIKLILPYGLVGLKYIIDDSEPWGPVAFFTSSTLEKADVDSQCISPGPIGAIWRVPKDPKTISNSKVSVSKQVGESYVVYQHPQGPCSNNTSMTSLQISQIKLFQQTINDVVSIK